MRFELCTPSFVIMEIELASKSNDVPRQRQTTMKLDNRSATSFLTMKQISIFFGSNNHHNWKCRESIFLK